MAESDASSVHIRWMIRRDMPEVLEIETASFPYPWDEDTFIKCLRQRNCIGMVAEIAERVAGFMIYELEKDVLHLVNFAVAVGFRRQGVGRQLAQKLTRKLSAQRRTSLVLEVSEVNLPAHLFFRSLGFRATGVLSNFYEAAKEDAYRMEYRLEWQEWQEAVETATRRLP